MSLTALPKGSVCNRCHCSLCCVLPHCIRLLKDSLRGNSRTAMVATISAAADQYHHSVNTLKYADRAKEIKTHVVQNVGSVERHITDYQNIIDNLQVRRAAMHA